MNISEHTRIFKAYIDRMPLAELEKIIQVNNRSWHESLNGNAGSQRDAMTDLFSAIMEALEAMSGHDRTMIAAEVSSIVNRKTF